MEWCENKQVLYDTMLRQALDNSYAAVGEGERTSENKNAPGEGVRYQGKNASYDFSKSFAEQIDDYRKGIFPQGDTMIVGSTPKVLQNIGLLSLPMTYTTTHLDEILTPKNPDHNIGVNNLKLLPQALETPIAVFDSATQKAKPNSIVVLVDLESIQNPILAAVVVEGKGKMHGEIIGSNAITSVHIRQNAVISVKG